MHATYRLLQIDDNVLRSQFGQPVPCSGQMLETWSPENHGQHRQDDRSLPTQVNTDILDALCNSQVTQVTTLLVTSHPNHGPCKYVSGQLGMLGTTKTTPPLHHNTPDLLFEPRVDRIQMTPAKVFRYPPVICLIFDWSPQATIITNYTGHDVTTPIAYYKLMTKLRSANSWDIG